MLKSQSPTPIMEGKACPQGMADATGASLYILERLYHLLHDPFLCSYSVDPKVHLISLTVLPSLHAASPTSHNTAPPLVNQFLFTAPSHTH